MSLAEHIDNLLATQPFRCKFARALDAAHEAEPEHAERLAQAIVDGNIDYAKAAAALTRAGYKVSDSTAQKHGRRACGCDA